MHSFVYVAAALSSLFAATSAQIDPNSVPLSTRSYWCTSQTTQCPLICTQTADGSAATDSNTCDPSSLTYSCVCGNGLSPNASEYSQTLPYFICTQVNQNCQANCGNSNTCQAACVQDHPCGAQNPTRINATTTTSGSSAATGTSGSASGTVVYTGFGGAATSPAATSGSGSGSGSTTTKGSGAVPLIAIGELYGLGVVAAAVFAGFGLLL